MSSKNYSVWTKKVELNEIYDDFNEDLELLNKAYVAMQDFCRKEIKKVKSSKKRKSVWT